MASQYSLSLKAILDTTQVKQELQKLRQMQNQILGNNRGNSVNGSSSNSNNLGNINGLNSTLSRLTNSINQLNNAINKLNAFNQKSINSVQPQQNVAIPGRANIPQALAFNSNNQSKAFSILNGYGQYERDIQLDRFITDNKFREQFNTKVMLAKSPVMGQVQASIMGAFPLYRQFESMPAEEYAMLHSLSNNKNFQSWYRKQNGKSTTGIPKEVITGLGGMVVNQAGQDISQILAIQGHNAASEMVSWGSAVGGGALAGGGIGAGLGGIIGAGIGAGLGALVGALGKATDEIQKCATEIADAAKTMQERIKAAAVVDTSFSSFKESLADKNALKKEDEQYFKDKIEKEKVQAKNAKDFIDSDVLGGKSLVEYEQETHKLEQAALDGLNDEEQLEVVAKRKKTANDYIKAVNDYMQSTSKIEQAQSTLDGIKEKQKAEVEKEKAEVAKEKQKAEAEKERVTGFNKIIDNEKLGLTRYNESNDLNSLIKTGDIDGIRDAALKHEANKNKAFNLYQSALNEAALATDSKTKEELLEKASKYKSEWQYSSNIFNNLNQNLGQLLVAPLQDALSKLQAPDMQNVNSLASQGVMINRADDNSRQESIINFQREQTELQRKIEQLLKDNSFVSKII